MTVLVAKKKKKRDPAASSVGGKARAAQLAQEQRIAIAKLGSEARNKNLTAKQRSDAASKAANERWGKWRQKNGSVPC